MMQTRDFSYVVGIDAGGTKSAVRVWNVGGTQPELVGEVRKVGLNLDLLKSEEAIRRLESILHAAAQAVGSSLADLAGQSFLVLGMAGLDTPLDVSGAENWLTACLSDLQLTEWSRAVISDVELGLWAARPDGVGVVLIAGTGSNCFGRDSAGKTAKAGGLSHFFSDEGSGFMLGWRAFHLLGKMYDGRLERTALYDALLQAYSVTEFAALKQKVVRSSDFKYVVAKAAPVVQELAQTGEPHAQELVQQAIDELAQMVLVVQQQLTGEPPVFLVGSLFKDQAYKQRLMDRLQQGEHVVQAQHIPEPVIGALAYWQHQRGGVATIPPNSQS